MTSRKKQLEIPADEAAALRQIARESARMSFPARMQGHKGPIRNPADCAPKCKARLETYFVKHFPLLEIWNDDIPDYDLWHQRQSERIAGLLRRYEHVREDLVPTGLATKFLNLFMHQLMKYEQARHLYTHLHLPLDKKICDSLSRLDMRLTNRFGKLLTISPYLFDYRRYRTMQAKLGEFVDQLNSEGYPIPIRSKVELNWLWSAYT